MSRYNNGEGQSYYEPYKGNNFASHGWVYTGHNTVSKVAFYENSAGVKMDYYYTTGTVKTCMSHPRKGPTQLFRRDLSAAEQERVLDNPRAHTGKGYYTKSDSSYRGSGSSYSSYSGNNYSSYNNSSYYNNHSNYYSGGYGSYRYDRNERKEAYYGRKSYSRKYNSRSSYYDDDY